ncbi:MAG: recombinase family protein, partial [Deltaproteobacteria bacterium]
GLRCAIYTRKSTEKGLEQEFNSLHAQREACEAYIASQRHEGWTALSEHYDDPGFSGGNMERPGLRKLMRDIERGKIDCIVFYKLDRLSRSLMDFVKLAEFFERHNVTFVSITQQFSSTTAMGRLTLNILLSFAEFERAISAERVRDKIAAAKKKGKYLGGTPPYGYNVDYKNTKLVVNQEEAKLVRHIYKRFIEIGSCLGMAKELNAKGVPTKSWTTKNGSFHQGGAWNTTHVYRDISARPSTKANHIPANMTPSSRKTCGSRFSRYSQTAQRERKARRPVRSNHSSEASFGAGTATSR